jgi:glutamate synthase (NADPH/NADH) large chain
MSGGIAYVLDEDDAFSTRCNLAMVDLEPVRDEEAVMTETYHQSGDLEGHGRVDVMSDMTRFDRRWLRQRSPITYLPLDAGARHSGDWLIRGQFRGDAGRYGARSGNQRAKSSATAESCGRNLGDG